MAKTQKSSTANVINSMDELRTSASLANGFLLGVCNAKTSDEVTEYSTKLKDLIVEIIKYKVKKVQ